MEAQIRKLYDLQADITTLNTRLERLEKEKSDLLQIVAVKACATKKKAEFLLLDLNTTVQVSRRDYKKFTPDVDLLIQNENRRFEEEVAEPTSIHKSNTDAIKREAEEAKKYTDDIRYYLKIVSGDKE